MDQKGLTGQRQRMAPVSVEHGSWYYRVATSRGIALRSRCSFDESARAGKGPSQGAMIEVGKRVKLGEITFLKMQDDSAWIPDSKEGKVLLEGPIAMQSR